MCTDTVSKVHLQEDAAVVLERGCNFVPAPTLVAQLFLLSVRRVPEVNGPMGRFNRRAPKRGRRVGQSRDAHAEDRDFYAAAAQSFAGAPVFRTGHV